MKQKSYCRYLLIILIFSLDVRIVFPMEVFRFEPRHQKETTPEKLEVFGFEHRPSDREKGSEKVEIFSFMPREKPSNNDENNLFWSQFVAIEQRMVPLSNQVKAFLKKYKEESRASVQLFSFLKKGQAAPAPSLLGGTTVNIFDKEGFSAFEQWLVGQNLSYLSLLNQVWPLYAQQNKALIEAGDKINSDKPFVRAFAKDSLAIAIYKELAAQSITFLKLRFAAFSLSTFFESGAQYFLSTELPALDAAMNKMQAAFDAHFSGGADDFPSLKTIKGVDTKGLSENYCSIYTSYAQQRGVICAQFALALAQSLATEYQPSSALSQSLIDIDGNGFNSFGLVDMLSCLEQFYTLGQTALGQLQQVNPLPTFGAYQTPSLALQALNGSMASWYLYCALIGQNNITALAKSTSSTAYQNQMIGLQQATQNSSSFYPNVVQILPFIQRYYQKAAQYYNLQLDATSADAYLQSASYIDSGISYWNKAETCLGNNDFAGAVGAYQTAASCFKYSGNNALASVLAHRTDAVTLSDYQMLLQSYTQYYQFAVASFVSQMTAPLSGTVTAQQASSWHSDYPNGFVQMFYYDAAQNKTTLTPVNQGIAWLAGQAVPVFSHMLNAYQTDSSATGVAIKQYLQNSLVILENLIQASEGMFYNQAPVQLKKDLTVLPQGMAAHENLGSGSVQGVTEGALQYIKIYENFSKVDAVLSQPTTALQSMNGLLQLPYQGLFTGLSISGFAQFSLLAQIYWSLMNSDSCLELVKEYPQYTQTVVSSALILATQAQTLCTDPSLVGVFAPGYTAAISDKITTLLQNKYGSDTGMSLLVAEGDLVRKNAKNSLDYESALACYCAAGLAGNVDAQARYFETLTTYAQWYVSSSGTDYASFYAAALYYRGYLAQKKGWKSSFDSINFLQQELQSFTQKLTRDLQALSSLVQENSYQKAIEQVQKLVTLQDDMQRMIIHQKREQLCFTTPGVTVSDFIALTKTSVSAQEQSIVGQVPAVVQNVAQVVITSAFPSASMVTCPQMVDPLANLAQLYLAQGTVLLDGLKADFKAGNYGISLQETYDKIIQNFTKAIDFFGKSDRSEMIIKVQQALTDGTAFSYYSLVIPSDKVTNLLAKYAALQPSFSGQFVANQTLTKAAAALKKANNREVFSFIEPKSPDTHKKEALEIFGFVRRASNAFNNHSVMRQPEKVETASIPVQPKKVETVKTDFISENGPDYLLRYSEIDLTLKAQQEKQFALVLSTAKTSGNTSLPVVTYQDLLAQAQKIIGSQKTITSTPSDTSLVTSLAIPLYRKFLTENGYVSEFSTLDQEVERYGNQVTQLVTQGIQCGRAYLYASYALQNQTMSDGTQHIIFVSHNGPLSAIPRFQGEYQTALYYYTQYGRFYAYNPETVQIGGTVFFQLPDQKFTHQADAFKGVIGAYFALMNQYDQIVENCMKQAPPKELSLLQKKNYSFDAYSSLYQKVASAYSWVFSALNGVQTIQQNQGIYWVSTDSFNGLNFLYYSNYMNNNARFLIGYPLSSSYKQVLTDISVLSSMAMSYANEPSDQAILSRMVGQLYESSGDLIFMYEQQAPAFEGYPSIAPTNLPDSDLNFSVKYSICALPRKGSVQDSKSFALQWGNYFQSSNFYLNAYNNYKVAYSTNALPSLNTFIDDADYRRAWGKYVSFLAHAVTQRLALFGRNALKATIKKTASEINFTFDTNDHFKEVLAQGQTYGGFAAQQGFAALGGGVLANDNSAITQNQYTIMKTLLLDAFIYCSAGQQVVQDHAGALTKAQSDSAVALLGKIFKCAFAYYAPGLQAVRGEKVNGETVLKSVLVLDLPNDEVGLDKLGNLNTQQMVYLNTFPALIDYCLMSLMGTEEDPSGPFNKLKNSENMFALSDFFSQLYGMLVALYTESFLPGDKNNPEKMGIDIQAAVQGQEQGMIVNAESYVG